VSGGVGLLSDLTLRPINDLATGLFRLERRTEFLWRDAFDRVLTPPAAAALQALVQALRRDDGLAIAEERPLPRPRRDPVPAPPPPSFSRARCPI
jgi:hypothetical protein